MAFGCAHSRCSLWCDHMKQRTAIHILRDCQPTPFSRPVRTPVSRGLAFRRDAWSLTPSCKVLGMRAHVCVCVYVAVGSRLPTKVQGCDVVQSVSILRNSGVWFGLSACYEIPGCSSVCDCAMKIPVCSSVWHHSMHSAVRFGLPFFWNHALPPPHPPLPSPCRSQGVTKFVNSLLHPKRSWKSTRLYYSSAPPQAAKKLLHPRQLVMFEMF